MATFYVDYSATTDGTGSPTSPFNTLTGHVTSGNKYVLRRTGIGSTISLPTIPDNVTLVAYPKNEAERLSGNVEVITGWASDTATHYTVANSITLTGNTWTRIDGAMFTGPLPMITAAGSLSLSNCTFEIAASSTGTPIDLTTNNAVLIGYDLNVIVGNGANVTILDVSATAIATISVSLAANASANMLGTCTGAILDVDMSISGNTYTHSGSITSSIAAHKTSVIRFTFNDQLVTTGAINLAPSFSGKVYVSGNIVPPVFSAWDNSVVYVHANTIRDDTGSPTTAAIFALYDSASLNIYPYDGTSVTFLPSGKRLVEAVDNATAYIDLADVTPSNVSLSNNAQIAFRNPQGHFKSMSTTTQVTSEAVTRVGGGAFSYMLVGYSGRSTINIGKEVTLWRYTVGSGQHTAVLHMALLSAGLAKLIPGDVILTLEWNDRNGVHRQFSSDLVYSQTGSTWIGISGYDRVSVAVPFTMVGYGEITATVRVSTELASAASLYIDGDIQIN